MALAEEEIERIEGLAEAVLAELPRFIWDGASSPLPVEDIADSHFGLLIRDVERMTEAPGCPPLDPGQVLSGLLLAERREIWVNADEAGQWPGRRRFTICHELGHWVMHRDKQASLFCRHGSISDESAGATDRTAAAGSRPRGEASGGERAPLPVIEEEANFFAAALLIPRRLLAERYRALASSSDRFQRLCAEFGASGAAMGRRLHQVI